MSAIELFIEAERCYRLARGIADAKLSDELEEIGREFEREARRLVRDGEPEWAALPDAAD
jgi:hypothetical protein